MIHKSFLCFPIMLVCCLGCNPSGPSPKSVPNAKPTNPGGMARSEIELRLKNTLRLSTIQLTEESKGHYVGTGTSANGTIFNLTVTQSENEIKWTYSDESGGNKGEGSFSETQH
jgi:hypothetical protein